LKCRNGLRMICTFYSRMMNKACGYKLIF
jgi:hypothetical protein